MYIIFYDLNIYLHKKHTIHQIESLIFPFLCCWSQPNCFAIN